MLVLICPDHPVKLRLRVRLRVRLGCSCSCRWRRVDAPGPTPAAAAPGLAGPALPLARLLGVRAALQPEPDSRRCERWESVLPCRLNLNLSSQSHCFVTGSRPRRCLASTFIAGLSEPKQPRSRDEDGDFGMVCLFAFGVSVLAPGSSRSRSLDVDEDSCYKCDFSTSTTTTMMKCFLTLRQLE